MAVEAPVAPERDRSKALEEWIDAAVSEGRPALEVAAKIVRLCMPGTPDYLLGPEFFGAEGWLWPWNRAGFSYIRQGRCGDAASLFTCAYLAALRMQHLGQFRIHKGMSLCNISYSHLSARAPEPARLPALLGMVEDALTSGKPEEKPSFRNLLAAGFPESTARSLGGFFLFVNREPGITPLYPEATLDRAQRGNAFASQDLIATMQSIAAGFSPDVIEESLGHLARAWERFRPMLAPASGRAEQHGQSTSAVSRPGSAGDPVGSRSGVAPLASGIQGSSLG